MKNLKNAKNVLFRKIRHFVGNIITVQVISQQSRVLITPYQLINQKNI